MKHLIRELRDASKMTQKEFADKFNIPLSTLKKWEQGVSTPPEYLTILLEKSIPYYNKDLIKIKYDDDILFYINKNSKIAYDSKGNSISFNESLDGVMEENLPIYLYELFKDFYEIQNRFNNDLKYDKKEKIKWR